MAVMEHEQGVYFCSALPCSHCGFNLYWMGYDSKGAAECAYCRRGWDPDPNAFATADELDAEPAKPKKKAR